MSRFERFWYRSFGEASFSIGILQTSAYFQASYYQRHLCSFLRIPFEPEQMPVEFDFPALTLWRDSYLVEKMGERQISVAVTPTG